MAGFVLVALDPGFRRGDEREKVSANPNAIVRGFRVVADKGEALYTGLSWAQAKV